MLAIGQSQISLFRLTGISYATFVTRSALQMQRKQCVQLAGISFAEYAVTRRKKSNWVDRFDTPETALSRVLAHAFGIDTADERLREPVDTILGMVEADATEVHVAGYIRDLFAHSTYSLLQCRLFGCLVSRCGT